MTDERKDIFIETVEKLFTENSFNVPPEALDFFNDYKKGKSSNGKEVTDKGIAILIQLNNTENYVTSKAIGEMLDISSKSVAGSLRKLVTDGYVDKQAGNPASYKISDKGIEYITNTDSLNDDMGA